ncbi:MAG: PhaM family polyhydroxyalkanoate granule multifunctional regulatory protein [Hydrogenophaga sp.]|uniref:PhaM family polyhydroxyalkanoate granule multifunctional regulatory protein n=1 Tax=Hydrogenophaga sp. TaxID=1904254 RepID=UPI002AB9A38B|nr:PhaM family polyhydroxyalkanoate granule multifunctional regulatory protein [Hydrogenophaga sp.]MDZ4280641.1 PhaM family polyhydroxyalkanoate granule multifunctional regulatory protein [Hydrogenophaga sp.]
MSDASSSGFGKFVPGFEFLQNLAGQAAGGVAQGIGQNIPQLPNLGSWVAPTFNVEDLEKRIEELKAVHFWLDQNSKALGATIQALEVQKMTLSTLKSMNFSMGDVANALKIKAADALAGFTGATTAAAPAQFAGLEIPERTYGNPAAAGPDEEAEEEETAESEPMPEPARKSKVRQSTPATPAPAAGGVVDPMQWWGAISQQFQQIASNAMKDVAKQTALDTTRQVASGLTDQAVKAATGMAGKAARSIGGTVARNVGTAAGMGRAAARAVTAPAKKTAPRPAAKKAPNRKPAAKAPARAPAVQPMAAGDWTMPTAFFPGFAGLQPAAAPLTQAKPKAAAKKGAARKAASPKPAARKTAAAKSARRR